jgi:hypothetical protein
MLNIKRALKQDRLLRAMTGLNLQAFDALLPIFTHWYEKNVLAERTSPLRQRAIGGGRKAKLLNPQDKLFFILLYFKCYPTFDLAGLLFDLERAQAHRWVHRLQPILEQALGEKKVLPLRQLHSIEEFIAHFPSVKEVIVDGTERTICRPKDSKKQLEHFSGKKKRHTTKNLAAVAKNKKVLVLTPSTPGKTHDKKIQDQEDIIGGIPDEVTVLGDLGFQGVQKQYVNIRLPHKKPRGGELTQQQKQENRELAQERVICENAFSGVKRYNAVSDIYRNRLSNFDARLMLTACGLWNFYLEAA